ncbi:MAG: response regulator, partial [Actinobacteria bacterium]|nr:response regulator [Actinomycetota bacterium]
DAIGFRKREGVGIGLALTKELVDLYHGEIFANNKKNGGAIFTVRLPLELTRKSQERKDNDVTADSAGEIEQDENEKNKPLILIIDDSEDEREYIRDELSLVYSILEAKNGKEGLEKAVKAMPDLIVSDIMMPVLDGIELCKKIRRNKITSHIPLILLTARNSEEYQLKGLKTGADDYVTKPFNIRTLRARIQNLLESRKKLRKRFSREIKIQPKDITITPIDEKFLQHAIEIVEEHISDEKFDVGMFCEKVGMSRSQLFRKLKALTSQTPLEFIRTIRLKRAAQLLEKSQFTVTEICYQVGFNYPSHFTQHFHAQFGVAPKEYRKRL